MNHQKTAAVSRLSWPEALAFATVSIPVSAIQLATSVHLPRYFATHLGLTLAAVGAAFALVRFIDIPIDTLIGVGIDRTRTRFGRYRVWMTLGAPLIMAGLYMLLLSPAGVGQGYLVGWLLVMYIGYSAFYLGHIAWAGALSTSYAERSRIFGAVVGLGIAGAVALLAVPIVMPGLGYSEPEAVQVMIWCIIACVPLSAVVVLASTPEPPPAPSSARRRWEDYFRLVSRPNVARLLIADLFITLGPAWMSALYLYYIRDTRGFDGASANILLAVYLAAGCIGAPLAAQLANRISKHRTLMVVTGAYATGLFLVPLMPAGDLKAFGAVMLMMGAAQSGGLVMIRALAGDIADELQLETGREWMGLIYALINATGKLGHAAAIFLTFTLALTAIGYDAAEGAVNSPEAVNGLQVVFIGGPVFFILMAGLCFIRYPLTAARHAEIRRQLDARNAG